MQAEEWEDIKRFFDAAMKLVPAERGSFLAAACADNPFVLNAVNELLEAHDEASGFLDEQSSKAALPAVFSAGQLVADRFRIVRLISRGGMGEVYETFDERLSVRIALKTLRPEYASDVDSLERFRREIRVTRDIGHANLCRVYELVEHRLAAENDAPERIITCLTMQLMSGETLQQYLAKAGPLRPDEALPLIKQIAGAVGVLHENGIVHRDLKPSNVMITQAPSGEPRAIVMDFGLAKPFNSDGEAFKSRSSFNAGAPFFLSPELVRGEAPSIASDIYAFGLIVDEMVTSQGAFEGENVESILYQKLWGNPTDPQTRAPGLPDNWCQAIQRCLQRSPDRRPGSTAEVVRQLEINPGETKRVPRFYRAVGELSATVSTIRRYRPSRRIKFRIVAASLVIAFGASIGILTSRPLKTSVVTFEFENLTGKPENSYLSKGVTREVERRLAEIHELAVMPFHGIRPKDARIKLDARFSLDGQLQVDKSVTQLSVQVVENSTGTLICAKTFENNTGDTLEMQRAIASSAVDAIRDAVVLPATRTAGGLPEVLLGLLHIVPVPGQQRALAPPTDSPSAMTLYMRGHSAWEESTSASNRQAITLLKEATGQDNNFALAYAALSAAESSFTQYNEVPKEQLLRSAREHALLAVAKGPNYAEAYAALAATDQTAWDWRAAEQHYKRAIEINPKLSVAHRWYGGFLMQFGKFDEGLSEARKSISLDPYDLTGRLYVGTYLCFAGKPQEAITQLQKYLAEKDNPDGHFILSLAYAQMAMGTSGARKRELLNSAMSEAATVAKSDGKSPDYSAGSLPLYALLYALEGEKERSLRSIEVLQRGVKAGVVSQMDLVDPYVALGDSKTALQILRSAAQAKDRGLMYLKVDPFLQPLRNSPEYRGLIQRIGL